MYGVGFNSAFGEERPGPVPLIPAPLCHPRPPHRHRHIQKHTHAPAKREREREIERYPERKKETAGQRKRWDQD